MRENGTLPRQTTDAKPVAATAVAGRIDAAGVEEEVIRARGGVGRLNWEGLAGFCFFPVFLSIFRSI